jgi:hypothetical protein
MKNAYVENHLRERETVRQRVREAVVVGREERGTERER